MTESEHMESRCCDIREYEGLSCCCLEFATARVEEKAAGLYLGEDGEWFGSGAEAQATVGYVNPPKCFFASAGGPCYKIHGNPWFYTTTPQASIYFVRSQRTPCNSLQDPGRMQECCTKAHSPVGMDGGKSLPARDHTSAIHGIETRPHLSETDRCVRSQRLVAAWFWRLKSSTSCKVEQ